VETGVAIIDALARELTLFAAVGFLVGGVDDLLVDLAWLVGRVRGRFAPDPKLAELQRPATPSRFAIFVAAWREDGVIGAMLRAALRNIVHPDYRLYVGVYPNDPVTIAEVEAVARTDARVRLVIGPHDGPTTKGANLNVLWRALVADDARAERRTDAVVIHDAEDVIHPHELAVHEADVSQTPVVPLIRQTGIVARLVSGHYADEFAESHRAAMVVRAALGTGLPLAGVGCAVTARALERLAGSGGDPFEADSLTEDYEQGLRLAAVGCRARFMRVRAADGSLIATRAYFPHTFKAAVTQKARWLVGIALSGWDRIGWARPLAWSEHWMRMRDRRGPLAVLIVAAGYLALLAWGAAWLAHAVTGVPAPARSSATHWLLAVDGALLVWRMAARGFHTGRTYGVAEGVRSLPRIFVANFIALLAVRRAIVRYLAVLGGEAQRWDKTEHVFPDPEALGGSAA
jgi:adsorption protein B